jgi:hypothetical protein
VKLVGVATLFDPNHSPFGAFAAGAITSGMTFLLGVDGGPMVATTFGDANNMMLSLIGQDFFFQQNGPNQPGFYVGALEFSPVPIPGAVWLFASGIAGIGALARRRRKNQSAIAA